MKRNKLINVNVDCNVVLLLVVCVVWFGLGFYIGREFEASLINNESNTSAEEKIVAGQIADASDFDHIGLCDSLGQIVVEKDGKCGLIKNGGIVIIEPKYDWISDFPCDNGMREFRDEGLHGILDIEGNVILEPKYEDILIHEYDGTIEIREGLTFKTYKVEELIKIE